MRIQLANGPMVLGMPLVILALVLLANLAIFGVIDTSASPENRMTGGMISIYIVLLVAHLQTITQFFPFALSLSVTRRIFFAATCLVVLGQSVGYGLLLFLLRLLEDATGGWGLDMGFFALPFLTTSNALTQVAVYTVPFIAMSFLGLLVGIVFKRWGQLGLYTLGIGVGVLAVLLVLLATWQDWWAAIGRFFAQEPAVHLFATYPLVLAALLAGIGYRALLRATP
ncbi:hypothetical protein [Prauserella shujinwangii]|uniref:hypothetical protein n=1 Tax=Prauserella shujinwangii TaxID=1453103 RepID=UPI0031838028